MINPKQVEVKTVNVNAQASYETEKQNYATIALKCLLRKLKVT